MRCGECKHGKPSAHSAHRDAIVCNRAIVLGQHFRCLHSAPCKKPPEFLPCLPLKDTLAAMQGKGRWSVQHQACSIPFLSSQNTSTKSKKICTAIGEEVAAGLVNAPCKFLAVCVCEMRTAVIRLCVRHKDVVDAAASL